MQLCWMHRSGEQEPTERGEATPFAQKTKSAWPARLSLRFSLRDGKTVADRSHDGPLVVQKALYPEGPGVCHAILVHPPGGMVGGDQLKVRLELEAGSHALITTPGMSRWYRSNGAEAELRTSLQVDGATLEWLPLETIVYDRTWARMETDVELRNGAKFVGWEVLCLGRTAHGERFRSGTITRRTTIRKEGRLLWSERCLLRGGDPLLDSPLGLRGATVAATLLAAGFEPHEELVLACGRIPLGGGGTLGGVSGLPGLLVGHYLGHSSEAARQWLLAIWRHLRPGLLGRDAVSPRIWST